MAHHFLQLQKPLVASAASAVSSNAMIWSSNSGDSLNACQVAPMQRMPICGCEVKLAACKTLASKLGTRACSRLSTVQFATGPKRSMGHVLGAETINFLIRVADRRSHHGGRASGILSFPAQKVSLGSPRVGTIHVQSPTPHTPPLPAYFGQFSHISARGGVRG